MADKKISALTGATTPLAGTEVLPIVQSGATVKVAVSDLTAGRAVTALTYNGNTITTGTGVLTLAAGKTLTASNTLTLAGTDATTHTFPTTSATIARTDAAQTFAIGGTVQSASTVTAAYWKLQNPVDSAGGDGTLANGLSAGQWLFGATGSYPLTAKIESVYSASASFGRIADLIMSNANGSGTLSEVVRFRCLDGMVVLSWALVPLKLASAPTYVKGAIYFDTTLNKLRVGGAAAWETITSV